MKDMHHNLGDHELSSSLIVTRCLLALLVAALTSASSIRAQDVRVQLVDARAGDYFDVDSDGEGVVMAVAGSEGYNLFTVVGSTDGGLTWRTLLTDTAFVNGTTPIRTRQLFDIAVARGGLAYAIADSGRVFATTDSGRSWRLTQRFSQDLFFVDARGDDVVVSSRGVVYMSTDAGQNWAEVRLSGELAGAFVNDLELAGGGVIHAIAVIPPNRLVTMHSIDWGASWRVTPHSATLFALSFIDSAHGWAVGLERRGVSGQRYDRILYTSDAGSTWVTQLDSHLAPTGGLIDVAFLDRNVGLATGPLGKTWITRTGGDRWEVLDVPLWSGYGPRNLVARSGPTDAILAATDSLAKIIRLAVGPSSVVADDASATKLVTLESSGSSLALEWSEGRLPGSVLLVDDLGRTEYMKWIVRDRIVVIDFDAVAGGYYWLVFDRSRSHRTLRVRVHR